MITQKSPQKIIKFIIDIQMTLQDLKYLIRTVTHAA